MFWFFVISIVSARFLPYVEINAYPSEDEKIYSRFDAKDNGLKGIVKISKDDQKADIDIDVDVDEHDCMDLQITAKTKNKDDYLQGDVGLSLKLGRNRAGFFVFSDFSLGSIECVWENLDFQLFSHFANLSQKLQELALSALSGEEDFPEYTLYSIADFVTDNGRKADLVECKVTNFGAVTSPATTTTAVPKFSDRYKNEFEKAKQKYKDAVQKFKERMADLGYNFGFFD